MSTDRIEIKPDNTEPTLEQSSKNIGSQQFNSSTLQDANSGTRIEVRDGNVEQQQEAPQVDRPEWLPPKFKNAQDLAKAYSELEKKLSTTKESADQQSEPNTADANNASNEQQGLDKFYEEYAQNGSLSDKSYKELAKQGLNKTLVDNYIEGQKALADNHTRQVHEVAGGSEQYKNLTDWASQNLSENEVQAFNDIVETGTIEQVRFAVRGLMAQAGVSNTNAPQAKMFEGDTVIDNDAFTSLAQITEAMNNPKYEKDPSYRRQVEEKLSRSSVI